ncbi:MAG: L,D-transpeptidase family protein [Streptosporangiales bacterium]|nr:L,D-transpeptidase family protein [Streptosporangiales bacterium]
MSSAAVLAGAVAGFERSGLLARWTRPGRAAPAGRRNVSRQGPSRPGAMKSGMLRAPVSAEDPAPAPKPKLTRAERRECPPSAAACADLTAHAAWLQDGGKVTYGPVRMEPGEPGTPSATPAGTFHVQWKAGPHFVSSEYGDPMPWATFFAPGGVAFHGGSLTRASHGCVHLTIASARYFQARLPVGAEVVTFK